MPSCRLPTVLSVVVLLAPTLARGGDPVDEVGNGPADTTAATVAAAATTTDAVGNCPTPLPGTLTVNTLPWTVVVVDGVAVGTTPLYRAELPAGTHTLSFVNEARGVAVVEEIVIEEGRHHKLKLLLEADAKETLLAEHKEADQLDCINEDDAGYVTVHTTPWSRVFLDGRLIGVTPLFQQRVRAGIHALRFNGPAGQVVATRVQVAAGEVVKVALPLPVATDEGLAPR